MKHHKSTTYRKEQSKVNNQECEILSEFWFELSLWL